ncbi:DeoR family transcriptional regulator [Flaviaesturariibacter flavus]|uniref:DeoR family transcriptional regulator n=1 Tax=Flaviaesturariibacter flavus TaxID=2502780 RepID=A0A4R1BL39_9BACT|nr:ATP-binding protein [Flaviaesturariibacter flavus]TCJ18135.1 DeoR family transcriptional regulator [Flaviaesturariibacter flavus]
MPEHQNIEYKQSWHDDYLKWIVGFANSQGGTIFIGRDDKGHVIDVPDYKKLLEDLPNKIRDVLGIMVEVNLHEERGNHYLEIITPPYAVPISLRGVYYTRSGSTKQELKGNALIEFLLRKTGKSWDDVIEPAASLTDIDENAIKKFVRDAKGSGRLPDLDGLSLQELLEKLRLMEAGKVKRAALVLFGKDPGRFFPNMVVKMGRFGTSDDDLRFQETAEGNLIRLLIEVPDVLNHKFFVKPVDFQGLQRIEKGEYPVAALREMLLNALVHRDYMGSTVQIRMYDDRFSIWNEGFLPQGLTLEALKRQHPSRPRNPLIADVCFKGGYIDAWGRGTLKIINSCKEAGLPEPEMKEQDGGMLVSLFKDAYQEHLWAAYDLNERQKEALKVWKDEDYITTGQYQQKFDITDRTARRDLTEMVALGLLEKTGDKKTSKYRFRK